MNNSFIVCRAKSDFGDDILRVDEGEKKKELHFRFFLVRDILWIDKKKAKNDTTNTNDIDNNAGIKSENWI